jgi:hypothetical protein
MVQSALNLSHMTREPRSLAERIAAELPTPSGGVPNALDPPKEEPTVSSMAERFAPEPPKPAQHTLRRPMVDPIAKARAVEPGGLSLSNRGLLSLLFFVSLLPAMLLLALVWYGGLKLPASPQVTAAKQTLQAKEALETKPAPSQASLPSHQASLAGAAPQAAPPAKPEVKLLAPLSIEAKPGEAIALPISVDSSDPLPARSVLAVRAMPDGASLSKGRPYGDAEWSLNPDELADLSLRMPENASDDTSLRIELVAPDGAILATAVTRLEAAPDPKAALIVRADESGRIDGLIDHGQKMIDVGYFAGARAYFQRAAEAGSGDAALALGATYDPAFIEALEAQGIKADPVAAQLWYARARELGVEDQEAKLAALKEDWANPPNHEAHPAAEAEVAKPATSSAAPESGTEAAPDGNALTRLIAATGLGTGGEWVEVAGAVNVRESPSATGQTLRVAEKGAKLRVMSREGNWVQVSDPTTSETGWIYARFVQTSSAP